MLSLRIAAISLAMAISAPVKAAEITAVERNLIMISGEIVKGDADKFEAIAVTAPADTLVILSSGGGGIFESMMMGEVIRARHFATGIPNDAICASACGLIWLAGTPRYIGSTGKVGFHAAYVVKEGVASEIGNGNALIGAYLTKLGLSYNAIFYITSASPDGMAWLHPTDAQRLGIDTITIEKKTDETPAPPTVAQLPHGSPLEQKVMGLIVSYYALWSRGGMDVEALAQYYKDSVAFYGAVTPLAKIMDDKRKFSVRWPVRKYTVMTNTLFAKCSDVCSITGVVEWEVASVERNAQSTGTANFVVKFDPASGRIIAEDGSVLASHSEKLDAMPQASPSVAALPIPVAPQPIPQQPLPPAGDDWTPEQVAASGTPSFAAGRVDRTDYEKWFEALAPGAYQEGAMFWAENRSIKPTPTCNQAIRQPLWIMGCSAGKAKLDNSDYRRRTDRNYWLGWNSI